MVKIPRDPRRGRKVVFRDARGRFVAESERYQRATTMQRQFRGRWVTVVKGTKVLTPRRIAELLPRDEFEALAPNYGPVREVRPEVRKYTAWNVAEQVQRGAVRGVRGRVIKVTMKLLDGKRMRKVPFYYRVRRKGNFAYGLFKEMNAAIGNQALFLYDRVGSKLLPDRKGRKVRLTGVDIQVEM